MVISGPVDWLAFLEASDSSRLAKFSNARVIAEEFAFRGIEARLFRALDLRHLTVMDDNLDYAVAETFDLTTHELQPLGRSRTY